MADIAIENGHRKWIFPLIMVIFHSYVSLPEGNHGIFVPRIKKKSSNDRTLMEIVGWEGIVDNLGQLFSSTPQANNTKPTSNNCEVFAPCFPSRPSLLLAVLQFHSQRFQLFTP